MSREDAERPIVGLVPAAGQAARLGRLPCSKEIFPVSFEADADGDPRPVPVCAHLLRGMAGAGISRAVVVLRDGKWDVASRLGDGSEWGLDLAYVVVEESTCVPETLARAGRWIEGCDVALGFPDILLEPSDAWTRLARFHRSHRAPVSLGLFPTDQAWKADMVSCDDAGRVREIVIKDPECPFRWTWSIALWRPPITELLLRWVKDRGGQAAGVQEPYIGDVFRAAIADGHEIRALEMPGGRFTDVGTAEDLRRAVARGAASSGAASSGVA